MPVSCTMLDSPDTPLLPPPSTPHQQEQQQQQQPSTTPTHCNNCTERWGVEIIASPKNSPSYGNITDGGGVSSVVFHSQKREIDVLKRIWQITHLFTSPLAPPIEYQPIWHLSLRHTACYYVSVT
ncbi:hypothetical protein SK128_025140 [Halocaridina rubra]|uniref:Uncharacterized protein n=1 Tax=Halocaridina rubra TaxID=373956 RepID=A0AAN9A8U3_HALRR